MGPVYQLTLIRENPVHYPLTKGETSFGRSANCDVRIYDKAVSNIHAKLFLPGHLQSPDVQDHPNDARLVVLSSNGCKVNNVWIRQSESAPLPNGAVIDIVGRRFEFGLKRHQPPLLDTPRAAGGSTAGTRKVRQSLVNRAVLNTPAKTPEHQDLMQWSDEDEVSVESKQDSDSSDSSSNEDGGDAGQQQLCISPRRSSQPDVAETERPEEASQDSDEEVENSLLQQSPPPSPVSAPAAPNNTPERPALKLAYTTGDIAEPNTPPSQLAVQPLVRAQSMPSTTPRKRRKSLYEKVLIKSAVKAANHRRSLHAMSPVSPNQESQEAKDDGGDSSDSLSDPDDEEDVEEAQVEEDEPEPQSGAQLESAESQEDVNPTEQPSPISNLDSLAYSDEDQDEDDYEVHQTSTFSSEDDDLEELDIIQDAKQQDQPGTQTEDLSYIDPELLELDEMDDFIAEPQKHQIEEQPVNTSDYNQTADVISSHDESEPIESEPPLSAVEAETGDQTASEQSSSYFPVPVKTPPTEPSSVAEPVPAEAAVSTTSTDLGAQTSTDSTSMMTPAESTPPSARASRAARRSSGIPATPTQRSPNSRRRRSSTTLPKESPSTKEDSSTNNTEAPVESAALEPPQEPENEAAGTTESIPSDLAEFRREMALEAEGKFVPPPMNDSYATPQRPRPAAPRKSALKNANSRPTSPSGTPGSVLGKRKVLFNETTEYKTIASIHDEEYKREQREMCFVGEVKRRRTSNRLSMDGAKSQTPAKEAPQESKNATEQPAAPIGTSEPSASEPAIGSSEEADEIRVQEPSPVLHVRSIQENPQPCTPTRTPGKARRVATKTPPAAVARAAQELQLQSAYKADVPEKVLPKPSRSVSPIKRTKAETQLNMAQLLASPAPKLNHDVFKAATPKTAPPKQTFDSTSVQGVRAQLEQARRQSLSPLKAPSIFLSPAALGFPEPKPREPLAPPSPSPSPVQDQTFKPPTSSTFTPFLSGVKNLLQLPAHPPKTPSFTGLSSMFKQPKPAHEVVDWSSHLDPAMFKSPLKTQEAVVPEPEDQKDDKVLQHQTLSSAQNDAEGGDQAGSPALDQTKLPLIKEQTGPESRSSGPKEPVLRKATGIPARARRVPSASRQVSSAAPANSTPQTSVPRRTTRAATGSLKSVGSAAGSTTSSKPGPPARATRTASAATRASADSRTSQVPARSVVTQPSKRNGGGALAAAPPKRAEVGKENNTSTVNASAAKRQTARSAKA